MADPIHTEMQTATTHNATGHTASGHATAGEAATNTHDAAQMAESQRVQDERKLLRRLQTMMNMTMQVILQDRTLTVDEASQMIADSRNAALSMFPGKELAYNLIWKPRFQRLMLERFRLQ